LLGFPCCVLLPVCLRPLLFFFENSRSLTGWLPQRRASSSKRYRGRRARRCSRPTTAPRALRRPDVRGCLCIRYLLHVFVLLPCVHAKQGRCNAGRTCRFSHDPSVLSKKLPTPPCKFFQEGRCTAGDACPYGATRLSSPAARVPSVSRPTMAAAPCSLPR
jgi:hypothetical protein